MNYELVNGALAALKEAHPALEGEELEKVAGQLAELMGKELASYNEVEVDLEKVANAPEGLAAKFLGKLTESAGSTIGGIAAGAAGGAALYGIGKAIHGATNQGRARFEEALRKAVQSSEVLSHADPAKVKSFAETIFRFGPNVAQDPNLLRHILDGIIDGQSVDVNTIKMITEIEERHGKNSDLIGSFKNVLLK